MGYIVPAEISCGEVAVDAVSHLHPDLVLMDIRLSGEVDGIVAAEEIQRLFKIPVVYLTSNINEYTLERVKTTRPRRSFLVAPRRQMACCQIAC